MKTLEKKTVADYEALPEGSPYQLVEGELIMSPAPGFEHFRSSKRVFVRLYRLIEDAGKGEVIYAPVDLYLDEENAYQPDIMVVLKGSKARITSKGVYGPPDVVVEILSPSTAYYDLRVKKKVYERAGVREYWIVDPMERSLEIYTNSEEGFKLTSRAVEKGKVFSKVLDVDLDLEEVFKEV
ncbi:Uma2 family endonuclease [Pampinifervens florentissimum]|uniref:Uma2 family endonuclease n=1 Tax=Pampinifervens florentissimum TaxID=1632019 RepID=UPI0013B47E53|nr:Uma2 family endonuclease [Hydrogenobacter sp. T-8]QID32514.1 Uma2 family endonuclease [Hydrogenobacter sp. T-8]